MNSIDWHSYDLFFQRRKPQQEPLNADERGEIEALLCNLAAISAPESDRTIGLASPPGRFAQTVIRLDSASINGLIRQQAVEAQQPIPAATTFGIKFFKTTKDATREAQRIIPFQRARARSGEPLQHSDHFQKTLAASWLRGRGGEERGYILQEWIEGMTLEELYDSRAPKELLAPARVHQLVSCLYFDLVLEIWSTATAHSGVVWDWRDAQLVVRDAPDKSTLTHFCFIDSDAFRELTLQRDEEQRSRQERSAFARLKAMTARLLEVSSTASKNAVKRHVNSAWQSLDLGQYDDRLNWQGILCSLGRTSTSKAATAEARDRLQQFIDKLF